MVIPVTRVPNGKGGWADLLTKDSKPPSLCRQCTAAVFLGLINTCLTAMEVVGGRWGGSWGGGRWEG